MTKPIPEAMRLRLREYYLGMVRRVKAKIGMSRRVSACDTLGKQFPRYFKGMTIGDIHTILYLPSEEECREEVAKHICPRCGHGDNLVMESRGSNEYGSPQSGYDIYCTTPDTESTTFSKCWYHLAREEK